jgi:hypothetical protein
MMVKVEMIMEYEHSWASPSDATVSCDLLSSAREHFSLVSTAQNKWLKSIRMKRDAFAATFLHIIRRNAEY